MLALPPQGPVYFIGGHPVTPNPRLGLSSMEAAPPLVASAFRPPALIAQGCWGDDAESLQGIIQMPESKEEETFWGFGNRVPSLSNTKDGCSSK